MHVGCKDELKDPTGRPIAPSNSKFMAVRFSGLGTLSEGIYAALRTTESLREGLVAGLQRVRAGPEITC